MVLALKKMRHYEIDDYGSRVVGKTRWNYKAVKDKTYFLQEIKILAYCEMNTKLFILCLTRRQITK